MPVDCIFCRIVEGVIPSTRVYEDKDVLAFMDISPVVKGHTLVIPKAHFNALMDTPAETLAKLIAVVRKIGMAQVQGLNADGINVAQANGTLAGQIVPHIHFHVIPRFKHDGHSWNSPVGKYDSTDEMSGYADRILNSVGK